jgi:short-subunit dehydrogenase
MFGVPLDNRMEYVHTRDVGLALANAAGSDEIWSKLLLLGGGPRCQYLYREIVGKIFAAMGLDMLPEDAFTTVPFATDWLDTKESQRLLHFQTRTLDDYVVDMKQLLGPRLMFIRMFRGAIERSLLARSPFWVRKQERARSGGLSEKTALITGASSGIGAATARELAQLGARVILVARRADRLEMLADEICRDGGAAHIIPADLADEAECDRVLDEAMRSSGGVDILVNCAGSGWYGYGADMPWPVAREMLQTNVGAVAHLTLSALSHMRQRGSGHIVNISSVAGSLPEQGIAIYGATKSFVDAFTTSLHREMRGGPIRLSLIRPGAVRTEFYDRAASLAQGRRIPAERFAIQPEHVASKVVSVLRRPRRVVHTPGYGIVTPWIEPAFGWIIDLLGPALLRRPVRGRSSD